MTFEGAVASGIDRSLSFAALTCELTPASHRLLNPAAPEAPLCWGPFRNWR
jgi:hypothetical protein